MRHVLKRKFHITEVPTYEKLYNVHSLDNGWAQSGRFGLRTYERKPGFVALIYNSRFASANSESTQQGYVGSLLCRVTVRSQTSERISG